MGFIILFVIILLLLFYMYKEANKLILTEEVIFFPEKINEKTFLFISDLHRRKLSITMFQTLPPIDFVIIGGDLAERGINVHIVENNLSTLCQLGKTYFVWGNNDYEFGEEKLRKLLQKFEVRILENSAEIFHHGGHVWSLVGVADYGLMKAEIDKALSRAAGHILFISHNPTIWRELEGNERIVAILTGHTHGGQIRLGPFGMAEKGGWKNKRGLPLFISNGFGTRLVPFRFGAPPQIHIVKVKGCNKGTRQTVEPKTTFSHTVTI